MASRCTLVTSGHVASTTRRPRRRASWRTAGEMPWALKITVASSGTSSSSSTNIAPFWRSVSTTSRLWTISRRTYTGCGHTESASSTMSMARSTPAQKPRGPARRISAIGAFMLSSLEEEGYAEHAGVGLDPAVGPGDVAVGDVLVAVAGVDRRAIGDEVRGAQAPPQQEGEARADLGDLQIRRARERRQLGVGHETPQAQEVIAEGRSQAGEVDELGRRVLLIQGLQPDLERAVHRRAGGQRRQRQIAEADAAVDVLDAGVAGLVLEVELVTVADLGREHDRALHEGLFGIVGARRPRPREQRDERGAEHGRAPCHGSMSTFIAWPAAIRSSASRTPSSCMRCVIRPWGSNAPFASSSSTARRISSGVWWNAPSSASSS